MGKWLHILLRHQATRLDSILDDGVSPVLASCDTVYLAADSTFNMGSGEYSQADKSLVFLGGTPRPTIVTSSYNFFDLVADDGGTQFTFTFSNIDIETGAANNGHFIRAFVVGSIVIDRVDGDLHERDISLRSETITISNCELESEMQAVALFNKLGYASTVTVSDCVLTKNTGPSGTILGLTSNGANATLNCQDNIFVNNMTSSANLLALSLVHSASATITTNFTDNDLDTLGIALTDIQSLSGGDLFINLEGNNWEFQCLAYNNFIEDLDGTTYVDVTLNITDWKHDNFGEYYNWEDFGDSLKTGANAQVCRDTAYASFNVGGVDPGISPVPLVRYGDDAASGNTANASFNGTTGKWEAVFDVSSFTDGDFAWRPEVTLCDSTAVGDSEQKNIVDFADSLNTSPYTSQVFCDLVDLKFYVGGLGEYSSADVAAIVRYGDDSATEYTVVATFNSSTSRWEVDDLDISDFTDGDFYWRPEASVGICSEVGNAIQKHFHPGQCR